MKKPTLSEVKEYFKDAETIKYLNDKDAYIVDLSKEIDMQEIIILLKDLHCDTVSHRTYAEIWNCKKGYAEILTYKEYKTEKKQTFTITKEQVLSLYMGGGNDVKLKQWFPSAFEKELEVWKWYKSTYVDEEDPINKAIIFIDSLSGKIVNGYGFNYKGYWFDIKNNCGTVGDHLVEATEQEVLEALKNEAIKRGLAEGASYLSPNKSFERIVNYPIKLTDDNCLVDKNCCIIFNNGKWATTIPQKEMTQSDIEKELGYKIKIV